MKNGLGWGPQGLFPTNSDLADIWGRTDLNFDDVYLFDFLVPSFLDDQVPRSPNFQISRSPDLEIPRFPGSQIFSRRQRRPSGIGPDTGGPPGL